MKNSQKNLACLIIWSCSMTTSAREPTTRAWMDMQMSPGRVAQTYGPRPRLWLLISFPALSILHPVKIYPLIGGGVSDSQSTRPGFESRSDHYLDVFLGNPMFKSSATLVNSQLVCLQPVVGDFLTMLRSILNICFSSLLGPTSTAAINITEGKQRLFLYAVRRSFPVQFMIGKNSWGTYQYFLWLHGRLVHHRSLPSVFCQVTYNSYAVQF